MPCAESCGANNEVPRQEKTSCLALSCPVSSPLTCLLAHSPSPFLYCSVPWHCVQTHYACTRTRVLCACCSSFFPDVLHLHVCLYGFSLACSSSAPLCTHGHPSWRTVLRSWAEIPPFPCNSSPCREQCCSSGPTNASAVSIMPLTSHPVPLVNPCLYHVWLCS